MSIYVSVDSQTKLTRLLGELKRLDQAGKPVYGSIFLSEVLSDLTIIVTEDLTDQEKELHLEDCRVRLNWSNDTIRVLCADTRAGINLNLGTGRVCFTRQDRERLFAPLSVNS